MGSWTIARVRRAAEAARDGVSVRDGMRVIRGRSQAASVCGWLAVAAIFVAAPALGNPTTYVALVLVLVAALSNIGLPAFCVAFELWSVRLFVLAFLALTIAFGATGLANGQAIYLLDFLALPLSIAAAMGFAGRRVVDGGRLFCTLALAGAAVAAGVGIVDIFVLGKLRASGFENSPIHFADYAVILGFLGLGGVFAYRTARRWVFLSGPIFGMAAMALAGTRGAILVVLALTVVFSAAAIAAFRFSWLKTAAGGLVVLLALVVMLSVSNLAGFGRPMETIDVLLAMLRGEAIADNSTLYRFEMYRSGLIAFVAQPLFGYGWHQQIAAALPHMSDFARDGYAIERWGYIHNEPLAFAVAGGLFGLLAWGAMMLAPIAAAWQGPKDEQSLLRRYLASVLVVGLVVSGLTDVLFMSELPKAMLVVLGVGIGMLVRDAGPEVELA